MKTGAVQNSSSKGRYGVNRVKILVLGDEERACYHPLGRVKKGIEEALGNLGKIEFCTDYNKWTPQELRRFPVLISYIDDYKQLQGFDDILVEYILKGGYVIALHNGIITPKGSRLEGVYGGRFVTHPPYCELEYIVDEKFLGNEKKKMILEEEPYMIHRIGKDLEEFLWFIYKNKKYVAGWFRRVGKGKILYLAPGHDERTVGNCQFQKLLYSCIMRVTVGY